MNEPFDNIKFYTAGPWHYREGHNGEFLISCESGGFAPLARVKGDKRSTLKDAKANACLMAAAPDLLDALLTMPQGLHVTDDELWAWQEKARNAIDKAEGFK